MRIFTFVCALLLLGVGAVSYYGWEDRGASAQTLTSAIPAFVGAAMFLGVLIALLLRKTGLQIAFLASLMGAGLGIGRLLPAYLKETFDHREPFTMLMLAMAGICAVHVLVSVVRFVFRKRPVRGEGKKKRDVVDLPSVAEAAEGMVAIDENSNAAA
jgi:ABC-type uncharacterized transport system permease subunit